MPQPSRDAGSPLSWAAYITWLAIATAPAVELARDRLATDARTVLGSATLIALLALIVAFTRSAEPPPTRSRWPQALLLLQPPLALFACWALPNGLTPALLIIVAAQLAGVYRLQTVLLLLVPANLLLLALFLSDTSWLRAVIAWLAFAGFQGFAMLTADYAKQAETARDEALRARAEAEAAQLLLDESTRSDERLRLSRELHDLVGHKLTALKLQLTLAERRAAGAAREILHQCRALSDELLQDVRGVVGALRTHEGVDLGEALRALVRLFPPGMIELQVEPDLRLAGVEHAHALLRCAQEGVTNAIRHGGARHLRIALAATSAAIRLDVVDDGAGFGQLEPGNGLDGLRERLAVLGGALALESSPGRGTHLCATLPTAPAGAST